MEPCKTFWGFNHTWEKWVETSRGDVKERELLLGEWIRTGVYIYQERKCTVCGLTQITKEKIYF